MALVTRYFSTAGAGDANGTSWANRAALFDGSGYWSSVITGFNFSGSDALECRIGPGNYTMSQSLLSTLFTNAPTAGNGLFIVACDATGALIDPPDPGWTAAMPVWDQATIPQITISGNFNLNLAHTSVRLLTFIIGSVSNAQMILSTNIRSTDWVYIDCSSTNVSCVGIAALVQTNCCVKMSGSFDRAIDTALGVILNNVRAEGSGSDGSGNRNAFNFRSSVTASDIVGVNCNGYGMYSTAVNSAVINIFKSVFHGNLTGGIRINTALTTGRLVIDGSYISGNTGYGLDANSSAIVYVSDTRMRDNTSGNITGLVNASGMSIEDATPLSSAALRDAEELVDVAGGDYRIRRSSWLWGKGYGAGDAPNLQRFLQRLRA